MNRIDSSAVINGLLIAFASAGVLATTVIAPNSLIALEKPLLKFISGKQKHRDAARLAKYLKQQKLVRVIANDDGTYEILLTEKGKNRATRASFERLTLPKTKWDQKWRIVMFDIPEKYKGTRDYLAYHMKQIGFRQLQRSVFIFPHPTDDFIYLLRELFPEIAHHVIYLTASEIDNHNALVKEFSKYL